jgi:FMN-dependent oxidoreductase (nitrilotriacetate monooxygenase family)
VDQATFAPFTPNSIKGIISQMLKRSVSEEMVLVGFLQAQNCSILTSSWRNPDSDHNFLDARYYRDLAQTLEAGKFHFAFFDDRLAMPDIYGSDHKTAVSEGIRPVKLDPLMVLAVMGAATTHLGLGATCSTTYYEPYHVARAFQTLDHLSGGRAAWNVVTSLNDSEAANFGKEQHLNHDRRYDRADEFVEAVVALWNSWEDDALIIDRAGGVFADPSKVHRVDYAGQFVKSRGPLTVPRSPQGHPVLIQAGQSGRGNEFAARWGDVVFATYPTIDFGKRSYANVKKLISSSGRDPGKVKITPSAYVVVGESKTEAEDKLAAIEGLHKPLDSLVLLSEQLGFDFSGKPLDEPFSDEELSSLNGLRALRDRVLTVSGKANPTTRDFVEFSAKSTLREIPLFYGTPEDVVDSMEEWFEGRACDGFVIAATHLPGSYEDFARLVTPELQRRGMLENDYKGTTLRGNLGLDVPRATRATR